MQRIAISALLVLALSHCGNSGGDASGGGSGEQGSEQGNDSSSWSEKLRGSWDLEVGSFIDSVPPDKRMALRVLHLTFREKAPNEAEFRRYQLGTKEKISVVGSRRLLREDPAHPKLRDARRTYQEFLEAIPHLEITDTTFGYVNATKREADAYKVVEQSAKRVLIEVKHGENAAVERLEVRFRDADTLTITEVGKNRPLHFKRRQTKR